MQTLVNKPNARQCVDKNAKFNIRQKHVGGVRDPFHARFARLVYTVKDQKYFHNVKNSIDLRVFSCLHEKISCLSWSTYFHDFSAIWKVNE